MNLQRIRYFVAVAEELHFTRAAQRLYIDQGALSVAVRRLEQELGLPLFRRTSRRVELTEHGLALLPQAQQLLADAEAFHQTVRERRNDETGTLSIGLLLGPVSAAELTPVILDAFRAARPDVDLRVRMVNLVEQRGALFGGGLDVLIARPPLSVPEVTLTDLFTEPRTVELTPDHPLAELDEIPVELLQGLCFPQEDPRLDREFSDWAKFLDVLGHDAVRQSHFRAPENLWEQHAQVAAGVTIPTVACVPRLAPSQEVVHRPVVGVPDSRVAIASRADREHPHVQTFTMIAQDVADRLAKELVPGAVTPPPHRRSGGAARGGDARRAG
jgi:DNA-binding transcriptional LysR family regulator